MQLKTLLTISLAALALSGCIKEHPGECDVPDNLELIFTYKDAPDKALTDFITSVDVFLFDMQGDFFMRQRIAANELSSSATIRFTVPSGKYYAVAWGNVLDHSFFCDFTPDVTTFAESFVGINDTATETGDPVYYAPYKSKPGSRSDAATRSGDMSLYEIDIPTGSKTTKTMDFVRAHQTINVWIKGFDETLAGQRIRPEVKVTQRWSRYDFFFTPSQRRNYEQQTHIETVSGTPFDKATFYGALGETDNNIEVILTRPSDNSIILSFGLAQFIADNNITNTDEIDIMISFLSDQGVTIAVPTWSATPVQPGV